jgi:hypothetical protein
MKRLLRIRVWGPAAFADLAFTLHPSSFILPPFPIDIDPRRRVLWPVESERRHLAPFTGWLR